MQIAVNNKTEIERISLILCLGLLSALETKSISITEAEGYWFNPYTCDSLESLGISKTIVGVISHCCELEDVESLIPEKFPEVIDAIKNEIMLLLSTIPCPELSPKKLLKYIKSDLK